MVRFSMKDQYFGDVSHYKETGIIRTLSNKGAVASLICWMMTRDDGSHDGGNNCYLNDPAKWRFYDPELYDFLVDSVLIKNIKKISYLEESKMLPNTDFFSDLIEDRIDLRDKYFQRLKKIVLKKKYDLLFFETDNGIEVKSVKKGTKNSNKYLYWDEILDFYTMGTSLLLYQHFRRENRRDFVRKLCLEIIGKLKCRSVYSIKTSRFLMFLVPQGDFLKKIGGFVERFNSEWRDLVEIEIHSERERNILSESEQVTCDFDGSSDIAGLTYLTPTNNVGSGTTSL